MPGVEPGPRLGRGFKPRMSTNSITRAENEQVTRLLKQRDVLRVL